LQVGDALADGIQLDHGVRGRDAESVGKDTRAVRRAGCGTVLASHPVPCPESPPA
jgi:hypothetical protein